MRIGELADAARTKVSALRYYERVGLLTPTSRTHAGYRNYGEEALRRIALIHRAKEVGFTLREVRTLLSTNGSRGRDAPKLRELVDAKITALRSKRTSLHVLERELLAMRSRLGAPEQPFDLTFDALRNVFTHAEVTVVTTGVPGWFLAGSRPDSYEIGIAEEEKHADKPVAYLRCTNDPQAGFGTLMQQIAPDDFAGGRLEFSAFIRTEHVGRAGLWLRIDGHSGQQLAFDNMQSRPITGTTSWSRYSVVLDVDPNARNLAFGVLLIGDGEARIANCRLERVSNDVPTTAPKPRKRARSLDFSEQDSTPVA